MTTPQHKVLIFSTADPTGATHRQLEAAGCELVFGNSNINNPVGNTEEGLRELAQGCDALIGTSIKGARISRKVMDVSDRLRIVAKYTIGVDEIDVDEATEMGILVTHGPTEANYGAVAEGCVGMMLNILKKSRQRDQWVKEGGWRDDSLLSTYIGRRTDGYPGITIGLIGLGRVGGRFAELLRPWRARVIAYDPYIEQSRFHEHGVERVDLDTLLKESDVMSLHVVLNKETYNMIDARELAMMKPSAVIINTSRGGVINEDALTDALKEDRLAGAALDVFEQEPVDPENPLLFLGVKTLVSPHNIAMTPGGGIGPGIPWATESVLKALRGEVPDNVFNKEVIPSWIERWGKKA